MSEESKGNDQRRRIIQLLEQILAALLRRFDVANFAVTVDKPISQGDTTMAVKSLAAAVTQTMLDDQKALVHFQPLDSTGAPTSLPTGGAKSERLWSQAA